MAFKYLSDAESMADLARQIKEEDQPLFEELGHLRVEAVFDNRLFVVYKPTGLDGKAHRDPQVLTTLKVLNYECTSDEGSTVEIEDLSTGQRQVISHVPSRVFEYELFMSVPTALRLQWDARNTYDGKLVRSLSYALLIKSKNRSDWYSYGVTYAETPNRFKELFPNANVHIKLF